MKKTCLMYVILSGLFMLGLCATSAQAQHDMPVSTTDSLNLSGRHLSFGNAYLKNKQYEDAETQLLKAWDFLPIQEHTLKKRTQTARLLGRMYQESEQYAPAIEWYQKAVSLAPDDTHNKSAYRALANLYLYQENATEAINMFEKLLSYNLDAPTEIEYLYHLVVLNNDKQDFDRALHHANRWANLTPDDPRIQELLGKLHLRTGDEEEAIAQMEKVMEMDPNDSKTLSDLATRYQNRNETQKAFEAYERLHQMNAQSFLYLEKLRTLGKQLQKSETYHLSILQKMHQLQPKNLSIIETLADVTEDEKWIQKGFQIAPQNGHLQYLMGEIYHKKWQTSKAENDSSSAMTWYQKATADPTWGPNATHMINVINPPKTEEEKAADWFFNQTKADKKETINQTGKK